MKKDLLENIGSFLGDSSPMVTLNRMVLGYSAGVASVLAYFKKGLLTVAVGAAAAVFVVQMI